MTTIKDSGERKVYANGFQRDMSEGKGRMDLLPWYGIIEVSKHCEDGAKKYGEHNIDKGCPLHSLLDSASRHLAKCIAGMDDEDHLRAAAWNILWALNQRVTHPEMNDMPWATKDDVPNELHAHVAHAFWDTQGYGKYCSHCGEEVYNYGPVLPGICPECGAVMDGDKNGQ